MTINSGVDFLDLNNPAIILYPGAKPSLQQEPLEEIPEEVFYLTYLKTIKLANNALKEIPAEFSTFSHLRELNLHNNNFTELPDYEGKEKLTTLNLSENPLVKLSEEIGEFQNLEALFLGGSLNGCGNISDNLSPLTKLKKLGLDNCQLTKLPEGIFNLSKLRNLDLSDNQLAESPPNFLG